MLIEDILNEFKRTHLEHIEDIVLTDGYTGGEAVINYFRGLLVTLQGTSAESIKVSVKSVSYTHLTLPTKRIV